MTAIGENNGRSTMKNNQKQAQQLLSDAGSIARHQLEKMGAWLDKKQQNRGHTSNFQPVNIQDIDTPKEKLTEDLFKEQTLKASMRLVGGRFASYGKYLKKIMPDDKFDQIVDGLFNQVASLAQTWSQTDIPNQKRFANLRQLDEHELNALANDIANQNRALATLGGISNGMGLLGLLIDTLWLLLVSLRSIYQFAQIYDKPLTGKQGIKIAYDILAHANLNKMQDKQTFLLALGLGQSILNNRTDSLEQQIQNLNLDGQHLQFYIEQINQLGKQFGLELNQLQFNWVKRALPIGAIALAMHYNSEIIDEVLGVARATFAPQPKLTNQTDEK